MCALTQSDKTAENRTTSDRDVVEFLKSRFSKNHELYGDTFAQRLNDEVSQEIAEVMFSVKQVERALALIKEEKQHTNNTPSERA